MKIHIQRITNVFLLFIVLLTLLVPNVNAVDVRSSDYFARAYATAEAAGNGSVKVNIDIQAAKRMTEVGATKVVIYEQTASGKYINVKTYTRYNTSSLIVKGSTFAFVDVTYQGKSGVKYYAEVTMYAKDANGSETLPGTTNTVTA